MVLLAEQIPMSKVGYSGVYLAKECMMFIGSNSVRIPSPMHIDSGSLMD